MFHPLEKNLEEVTQLIAMMHWCTNVIATFVCSCSVVKAKDLYHEAKLNRGEYSIENHQSVFLARSFTVLYLP